ncbi:hypothetical protein GQX73_g2206 [Xylaria multiplex]|uniref:Uncharacterized protein n=1 Tax=Xylaria multiplex TaxID=323545 RepID=A0A7C8MY85_9PEZI|nr:hypothetical protein GQX73_g2206 [Xylaria multiplex]
MAFEIKAFDLTAEEKHAVLGEIRALVLATGALIARANKYKSAHDYAEALSMVNRALMLATDPDACDPSLAPLATSYLYKGHILLAMKYDKEAYEAYEKAAATETWNFTDAATSREVAKGLLAQWDKTKAAREKIESPAMRPEDEEFILPISFSSIGSVWLMGADGIPLPVTVRPGPARPRPRVQVHKWRPFTARRRSRTS